MSTLLGLKKHAKKIVVWLGKTLPESVFDALFDFLYSKYKNFVRTLYKMKGMFYQLSGDKKGVEMVKKIHQIMPYTFVGIGGLETTFKLAKQLNQNGIPGDFVELGVARGGCAALMGGVAFENDCTVERSLWLFDSFEGLPEPTEEDFGEDNNQSTGDHVHPLPQGACLGTLDEVKYLILNKHRLPKDKIFFIKGWFQDTLPVKGKEIGKIAILRIDGDWYESTKCCLECLYDQVVPQGAVIIDDYQSCFGCKKAVDGFIAERNLKVDIKFDGRGGCYFIKQGK